MKMLVALLFLVPFSASAYDCQISWNDNPASENVERYHVYVKPDGGSAINTDVGNTTQTSCEDVGLGSQTSGRYEIWLTAENEWGESDPSDVVVAGTPSAPINLQINVSVTLTSP